MKKRTLILASRSKARRKLLEGIGLNFKTAESNVRESRVLKGTCANLVMQNAYRKAKDVSRRFKSGIVIGADTVVLAGRRIIGKPKNIKDAYAALKLLSRKPQWVYTGIAVIDIDNKKVYKDCEKTKVYMYSPTDDEIRNYFKKVSPLDKAGSFDIQGLGGIFIDRIEGCFYNVVGLPLARLRRILKKIGVNIF